MVTKFGTLLLTPLFLATLAAAQDEAEFEELLELEETLQVKGIVTLLAKDSLTITDGAQSWTFVVDTSTHVIAKNGGHRQVDRDKYGRSNLFTDLIKGKGSVLVTYEFLPNGKLRAQEVRVL